MNRYGSFVKMSVLVGFVSATAAYLSFAQQHAPPPTSNRTGMSNVGEVLLPLTAVGGQYGGGIDPVAHFGFFGPSHSAVLSMIDLNGPLPKIVQAVVPDAMPQDIHHLVAIMVDYSDPDPRKHFIYAAGGADILKMVPGDSTHAPQVVAVLKPTSVTGSFGTGLMDISNPDPTRHYIYFVGRAGRQQPSKVLRVRLSDFSDQGAETLQLENVGFGAIDTVRHYGYFVSGFSNSKDNKPEQICKVNLANFHDGGESVATLTLDSTTPTDGIARAGFDNPSIDNGLVIDEAHGYAYFATSNYDQKGPQNDRWPYNESIIVRMKLGEGDIFPQHPLQELDLRPGERNISVGVFDTAHGNIYFGTDNTYPAHVYMIHVGNGKKPMRKAGRLDLNLGSIPLEKLPHDGDTLAATPAEHGEVFLRSAILDAKNNAIYFGSDSKPPQVIKVAINGKK